jgi:hypothetical protein
MEKLLSSIKSHIYYEVGISPDTLLVSSLGWTTMTFGDDYQKYTELYHHLQKNQIRNVTPIYATIGLKPSLDHFILTNPLGSSTCDTVTIGVVKLNRGCDQLTIINGLQLSLSRHLVECLVINIYPKNKPTNIWIELILSITQHGYTVYELDLDLPFDLAKIHQIEETTLYFRK